MLRACRQGPKFQVLQESHVVISQNVSHLFNLKLALHYQLLEKYQVPEENDQKSKKDNV